MIFADLTRDEISPQEALARVGAPGHGAVVLFLGVVRDHNEGRGVQGLEYEAYEEMAERVLEEIAREAARRVGSDRVAVIHRVGDLAVGDVSVAVAVSTPHRGEAYEASRYVIEEIKKRLPVWKRERYADGEEGWVPGHPPGEAGAGEGGDTP
jgi:molybdopterin synthase catalytic subunit